MRKHLLFVLIPLLFVSCATILNGKWTYVSVYTERPAKAIVQGDTLHTKSGTGHNMLTFCVRRSEDPLLFILKADSLQKTVNISSKNSPTFYLNALYFWPGFLVDLSNPKRYTYNNKLVFDKNLNLSNKYLKMNDERFATRKGDLKFYFSLPFIYLSLNTINPEGHSRVSRGSVFGLSSGFDYYYKDDKFINLTGSFSASNIAGNWGEYYWNDELLEEPHVYDRFSMSNLSVSHNHKLNRFSFGYGLSYNYTSYSEKTYSLMPYQIILPEVDFNNYSRNPYMYSYQSYDYTTLGLVFNGYCYVSRSFSVGLIYKPNIIRLKSVSKPFCYEHQITLDFAFRFNLFGRK